ncbi:MAG: recombinase family protein, partial [candidate division KSB1 bacterium]
MQPKITLTHLSRLAVIYIRQSSMSQVHDHQESRKLQYQLEGRAQDLGWSSTKVIDCDLGLSGSGSAARPGFAELLELVCAKAVGAIFCLEASRLARNNREWSHLIECCAIFEVVLIDLDGVYDPRNLSDRVLLGLKGTMSEYESGIFRLRAQTAIQEKAKRGEFYTHVPAGLELTPERRCEKDPNQRVRDAIALVFAKFRELGSSYQVGLWFRGEGRQLPTRAGKNGALLWKLPTIATIKKILTNPFYAGAYCYGRRQTEIRMVAGQPRKFSRKLPMAQWKILLPHHHEGYISWDEYLENQKRLQQNRSRDGVAVKGPAKRGPALLVGLLRCQKCGHRFQVRYRGAHAQIPRYVCVGQNAEGRNWRCLEFYGTQLETLVAREILRVVEPVALAAAFEAETRAQQQRREQETDLLHQLAHAEYEVNRCFEQYNRVDPKNRLVAQNLENRWEQAQQQVEALRQQQHLAQVVQPLSSEEREQLARDLPAVWHHPQAEVRIKKRILQPLLEEIVVALDGDKDWIFSMHWVGGKHTQYRVQRRRRGERRRRERRRDER